ncbi:Epidermal growth factor-like domain-containing protein [Strongyloides ratti]|uniref:Epidermal growth factor-like domain-containing protein n=1 Tax=Strongyloides ratti TaxID=34506 RepID=A0A090KZF2_STRRB|nr:Epidermal growth factor-like domain-containing protein [Strongyloides ratti]CEF62801.1 Epidermal growth factor-like domain-containing protein [Strongyloides ratti]
MMNYKFILFLFCSYLSLVLSLDNFDIYELVFHYKGFNIDNLKKFSNFQDLKNKQTPIFSSFFSDLFKSDFKFLDIVDVELSGLSKDSFDTVIFTGQIYINNILKRNNLIDKINKNGPLSVFKISKPSEYSLLFKGRIKYNPDSYIFENQLLTFGSCQNGGILLPNVTCECKDYFTGQDCEKIVCLNSGIVPSNGRCICPPGFISTHCEPLHLTQPTTYSFDFNDKSFIYVINLRDSMAEDFQYLVTNTNNDLLKKINTYKNFILTTYVSNSNLSFNFIKTTTYTTVNEFITALEAATFIYGDLEQPTLPAIYNTLSTQESMKARSNMFVFCDSVSSMSEGYNFSQISNDTFEKYITLSSINWNINIYFSLTSSSLYQIDKNADGFLVYGRLATASLGQVFDFDSTKKNIGSFVTNVLPFLLSKEIVDYGNQISQSTFTVTLNTFDDSVNIIIIGGGQILNQTPVFSLLPISIYTINKKDFGSINFQCNGAINYYIFGGVKNIIVPGFTTITDGTHPEVDIYSFNLINQFPMKAVMRGYNVATSQMTLQSNSQNGGVINLGTSTPRNSQQEGLFNIEFSNSINSCSVGYNVIKIQYNDLVSNSTYTRIFPTLCQIGYDLSKVPITCQNGGTPNSQGNGCTCTSDYIGNFCQTPLCYNGGSVNPYPLGTDNQCICINGYHGNHCEKDTCQDQQNPTFDISHRTFSIVMANVNSQAYLAPYIANAIEQYVNVSSKLNPDFVNYFTLTFYSNISDLVTNNYTASVDSIEFTSPDDLVNSIRLNKFPFSAATSQNSFEGLISSLNLPIKYNRKRIIFWFVDQNTIEDENNVLFEEAQKSAISNEIPVNIIYAQPFNPFTTTNTSSCQNNKNQLESKLSQLAYTTGGVILDLCTFPDLNNIQNLFTTFGQISYRVENVFQTTLQQCNSNQIATASFSSNDKKFVLINSNAKNSLTLSITDANSIPQQVGTSISTTPNIFLYDISSLQKNTKYIFGVNSQNQGSCLFTILEESDIVPFIAFTQSVSINYNDTNPSFGIPYHPVIHLSTAFQNQPTIELNDVLKFSTGAYDNTGILRSSSCSYDYFYDSQYACKVMNSPFYLTATISVNISSTETFTAQRSILSYCQGPPSGGCINGGTLNNGTCICPSGYSGNYCEKPLCYNGGTSIQNQCKCPTNYFGKFCQYIGCDSIDYKTLSNFNRYSYNTIIFIVENTADSANMNNDLIKNIETFINTVSQNNGAKEFVLITVDDISSQNIIVTPNPSQFTEIFKKVLSIPSSTSSGQNVKTFSGINAALQYSIYKPTIIYVFTTNGASDTSSLITTSSKIGNSNVQINYIYVPKTNVQTPSFSTSTKFMYPQLIAYGSGGRLIAINYGNDLSSLITNYLPSTLQEDAIVEDKFVSDSSKSLTKVFFPVENQTEWFTISILGKNVNNLNTLKVYNGNGNLVPPQQYETLVFTSGYVVIKISRIAFTQNFYGQWKVEGQGSSGSLRIQVRITSKVFVKVGFSETMTNDFVNRLPGITSTSSTQNYIAANLPYSMFTDMNIFLENARVYSIIMDSDTTTDITMFNFNLRNPDTCSFQYISPQITIPKMSIPNVIMIQINGQDQFAQSIQRLFYYIPTPINCINGVLNNNGFCNCTSTDFTGLDCNTIICKNGGTSDGSVCYCPPGYWGDLCEKTFSSTSIATTTTTTIGPTVTQTTSPLNTNQYFSLFICDKSSNGANTIENQLKIINSFFNPTSNVSTSLLIESEGQDTLYNNYTVIQANDNNLLNVETQYVRAQKASGGDITFLSIVHNNQVNINLTNTNIYTKSPGNVIFVGSSIYGISDTLTTLQNIKQTQNSGLKILVIVMDQQYKQVGIKLTGDENSVYLYQNGISQPSDAATWILQKLSSP